MLKDPREDTEKVKEMMYEHSGNNNEQKDNIKMNKKKCGAGKYSNWNEKSTRGIWKQIWIGRTKNWWIWRKDYWNDQLWWTERKETKEKWTVNRHYQVEKHIHHRSPRRRKDRERGRKIMRRFNEEKMIENFPNLMKAININIQKAQPTPSRMNSKKPTPRHTVIKLSKSEDKVLVQHGDTERP